MKCSGCGGTSPRSSHFFDLSLQIRSKHTLTECLEELFQPEEFKGSNQYYCGLSCHSKQDAVRSSCISKLPNVLQLHLMRFVYDYDSMLKKKLGSVLFVPYVLDMRPYVAKAEQKEGENEEGSKAEKRGDDEYIYHLTAVLRHKGASAYYGHYVVDVLDPERGWEKEEEKVDDVVDLVDGLEGEDAEKPKEKERSPLWWSFNDEIVRPVHTPGEGESDNAEGPKKGRKRGRQGAKKTATAVAKVGVSSKDAYMLVYTRKSLIDAFNRERRERRENRRTTNDTTLSECGETEQARREGEEGGVETEQRGESAKEFEYLRDSVRRVKDDNRQFDLALSGHARCRQMIQKAVDTR